MILTKSGIKVSLVFFLDITHLAGRIIMLLHDLANFSVTPYIYIYNVCDVRVFSVLTQKYSLKYAQNYSSNFTIYYQRMMIISNVIFQPLVNCYPVDLSYMKSEIHLSIR